MQRLWKPAVRCPQVGCGIAVDFDFHYCIRCGVARPGLLQAPTDVRPYPRDDGAIALRREELRQRNMERRYVTQYTQQAARFRDFLAAGEPAKHITFATPRDVVDFAISREPFARTRYHKETCVFRGRDTLGGNCACPSRMPPNSFQTLVGTLSSFLSRHGCSGEWNEEAQSGNPTASTEVRDHKKLLALEAAAFEIAPQKAVVFFSDKITRVVMHLLTCALSYPRDSVDVLIFRMDIALLLTLFASGKRGQDIANVPTQGCSFAPNNAGLFLRQQISKTIRGAVQWTFAPACPTRRYLDVVWGMRNYLQCVTDHRLPPVGPLFRNHTPTGRTPASLSNEPIDPSAFNRRVQGYLTSINLFEGESVHGLRAGRPIEMAIHAGDAEVAFGDKVWATPSIQQGYMELVDVMVACYRNEGKPNTWEIHEQRLSLFRQMNEQGKLPSALQLLAQPGGSNTGRLV